MTPPISTPGPTTRQAPRRRFAAPAASAALTLALGVALTGCMTVHGERANIPSVAKADAPAALKQFLDGYNTAFRKLDPSLVTKTETGPLRDYNVGTLKAQRGDHPDGDPGFDPLQLTDAQYVIPKQVGWPKFFLAETSSNRDDNRWLVVFTRNSNEEPWKASYLSILTPDEVPHFVTDQDGYAEPVPLGASSHLALAPDRLSSAYTDYLMTGQGSVFADGQSTSGLRISRRQNVKTPTYWTEYIDTPAQGADYAPVGLRTTNGSALVFFTSDHRQKQTMAKGYTPNPDAGVKALMTGTAKTSVTLESVAESAVRIPPKGAADPQVVFLNRLEGVTAAKGE
jgi:hypothetical protein